MFKKLLQKIFTNITFCPRPPGYPKNPFDCLTLGTVKFNRLWELLVYHGLFGLLGNFVPKRTKTSPKVIRKCKVLTCPHVPMCQKSPRFSRATQGSPEVPQSTQNPKSCPANLKPKTLQLHNHRYCVP